MMTHTAGDIVTICRNAWETAGFVAQTHGQRVQIAYLDPDGATRCDWFDATTGIRNADRDDDPVRVKSPISGPCEPTEAQNHTSTPDETSPA